jgi:hypothetical protein
VFTVRYELGLIYQETTFFIVSAVKTSNLTEFDKIGNMIQLISLEHSLKQESQKHLKLLSHLNVKIPQTRKNVAEENKLFFLISALLDLKVEKTKSLTELL